MAKVFVLRPSNPCLASHCHHHNLKDKTNSVLKFPTYSFPFIAPFNHPSMYFLAHIEQESGNLGRFRKSDRIGKVNTNRRARTVIRKKVEEIDHRKGSNGRLSIPRRNSKSCKPFTLPNMSTKKASRE